MVELVEYLKDPKKYSKFGARLPKGILLIGPPGTGKTLLAKAVAGEAHVPFYSISGSDFVEMYVGVGAGRVRDLFRNAKATAPCLIFIDEIDAVGRQRGAGLGGGNDEREQTLNQLLVEMDGFEANSGILVIAATNRDDVLDPALRRAGRFDRTITVSLPDKAGREAILKVHARNKKISPSVDFEALAKRTVGFSGADLDNVLNEAAILAVRGGKEEITIEDIDEAIDRRISGPAKSSKGLSEMERKQVAYHEAGHAIIGIHLPHSDKVQKITIVPRGNTGGHVLMTPEDDRFLLTKNELLARITGLLGGRSSEEIFFQDVTTGASNDIEQATRLARLMVTEFGMSDLGPIQYERDTGSVFLGRDYASTQRNFSTQVAYEIDKAVRLIIDEAHEHARSLIEEYKDEVILIAETLLDRETITAEEIEKLLKKEPEPEPAKKPAKPRKKKSDEQPAEPKPAAKSAKKEPKE
jgi:cell division protease FtsH